MVSDARVTFEFDLATAVAPAGEGLWSARIHEGWDIHGNANGGYVMAIAARAMAAATGKAHPVSVTMHYLAPATAGEVTVRTSVARSGRRFSSAAATIERGGTAIATAVGLFADEVPDGPGRHHAAEPIAEWTPFEKSLPRPASAAVPELMRKLDVRIEPADAAFASGGTGAPLLRGWFAFADGRPVDSLALLLASDVFPPVAFNVVGEIGWMPTLELTVHLRGIPVAGPVRCEFSSLLVGAETFDENGRIWDGSGRCVAMSRQLALLPRSAPAPG